MALSPDPSTKIYPVETCAVVVVTYNSAHVIEALLDSIPAALGPIEGHVVVVDNGSTDGTLAVLEQRSDCTVVRSTNVGYSGGINRAVAAAPLTDSILVLNPDVRLAAGAVPPLLAALGPDVGIAVPRILSDAGTLEFSLRREPTLLRALGLTRTGIAALSEYVTEPEAYDVQHPVDWALGAVLLISRACHDKVGGWDESYFLYSEETDFCLKARDLGLSTVYVPASTAVHIGGQSGRNDRTHAMQIVNRVRLFGRRRGLLAAWPYLGLTVLSEFSWLLRGHQQSRHAIAALLLPSRRPAELGCSDHVIPR